MREAFTTYAEGGSARAVGAMLEERTGGPWNGAKVHKLLSRPHYKGAGQYGVTSKKHTEQRDHPQGLEGGGRGRGSLPADCGRRPMASRPRPQGYQSPVPAARRESDSTCWQDSPSVRSADRRLTGQAKTSGRTGRVHKYYRCMSQKTRGLQCRPTGSYIPAPVLDARVWETVTDMLADPFNFAENVESLPDGDGSHDADLEAARRERDKVTTENDRLVRAYVQGIITETDLVHQRKFITERLEWTTLRVTDLETAARVRHEAAQTRDSVIAWAGRIGETASTRWTPQDVARYSGRSVLASTSTPITPSP